MPKFQAIQSKMKFHLFVKKPMEFAPRLHDLKGKDRGMAHKDINKNYREIRELEQRITDEVLRVLKCYARQISVLVTLQLQTGNSRLF